MFNIVWGTGGLYNIVWGTGGLDNIVWGTRGPENIVWGTADVSTVMFDDSVQPLPSLQLEFGDFVPLPRGGR